MTSIYVWSTLLDSLWDPSDQTNQRLPGPNLTEWLYLIQYDYDAVDNDHYLETIGGG